MDFDRTWVVTVGDKEHTIEADYGANIIDPENKSDVLIDKPGNLVVDGKVLQSWGSDLPGQLSFQIEGKNFALRKVGIFVKGLELYLEGRKVKHIAQ